jgi:predicted NAD-dependent protein-ADP-ribosyltransferase YbiA (DUF1768 family)
LLVDTYGVTKSAIYQWKHELKQQMQKGVASSRLTGAEKLAMVIKTASMNELQFGEFLRSNKVTAEEISAWKNSYEQVGERQSGTVTTRENKEAEKTIRKLRSELKAKEKALAEAAAILVLQGKADAIWGVNGEG